MVKITDNQIDDALVNCQRRQKERYGYDPDRWDYELVFDREYGWVTMFVTFSSGDVEEEPVNMTNLNNLTLVTKHGGDKLSQQSESLRAEIVNAIASGICTVPEDLVKLFNITYDQSVLMLNDPNFLALVQNVTKAKLNLTFHTKGVSRLTEMLVSEDDKVAMPAIKLIAQLSNNLKSSGSEVNVNLSLEGLVKEAEKNVTPLQDILNQPIDIGKVS